ncbi:MAG: hypothetical protein EPO21_02025 [Chloroflexota bacterium]|nr:MAG: hypothetical protein EPO21_02025 [Chloroflexota bacterium]
MTKVTSHNPDLTTSLAALHPAVRPYLVVLLALTVVASALVGCSGIPSTAPLTSTSAPTAVASPTGQTSAIVPGESATPTASPLSSPSTNPSPTATSPALSPTATVSATSPTTPPAPATATSAPSATPSPAQPAASTSTATWRQSGADLGSVDSEGAAFDGTRLQLAREGESYVMSGQAVSVVREAAFAFDTAVISWNAETPAGTKLSFDLRARTPDGWSKWYTMGTWGPSGGSSAGTQGDGMGSVSTDTLKLKARANALQYRITFSTTNPAVTPTVRLVAVNYGQGAGAQGGPKLASGAAAGRDIDVPRLSQVDQDPSVASLVCSPTSLTMVLRYWGIDRSVPETIKGVRDAATGIYGNWTLNTAYAGSQGLEAYVDRFYSVEQLEAEIAAGRPVIASLTWLAGELDNASVSSVPGGHLIVVRGFTAQGDVIVNDPASRGEGVRRVYKRAQFANVWLREGGIVYLVRPR